MRVVPVRLRGRGYRIRVVRGGLDGLGRAVSARLGTRRVALVTDGNVARHHGESARSALEAAGHRVSVRVLPPGERTKRVPVLEGVLRWMLAERMDRDVAVIALGGGVVGDLAGLAAALYMRGVDLVQAPTTLLAQVDSSVGGKTAVNLPGAKNAVGVFHQPRLVVAALSTLRTLPARDYRAGLGEVVKHGFIARPAIVERILADAPGVLARRQAVLEGLVADCCEVKRDVVERDEREAGPRRILNFGHTFGHAIEVLTDYRVRHGEAVALGMIAACRVSEALGLCPGTVREALTDVLGRIGLDTDITPYWRPETVVPMRRDKKTAQDRLHFVGIRRVGEVEIVPLGLDDLERMVRPPR